MELQNNLFLFGQVVSIISLMLANTNTNTNEGLNKHLIQMGTILKYTILLIYSQELM